MSQRKVVITAVGAVSPLGLTSDELWKGLVNGQCGIDTIKAFDPVGFPCKIAGEVGAFKIRNVVPKSYRKATKLMCRDIELSVLAADEAVRNSGLITKAIDPDNVTIDPSRMSITFGAGVISCDLNEIAPCASISQTNGEFDIKKWGAEGIQTLTPLWLLKYLPNMLACHVGIIHNIQGPSNTITCGEASAYISLAEASEVILRDDADVALAGGAEAKVNAMCMTRQMLLNRATVDHNDSPTQACRPFDADATGSVFGEAAGVLVLEEATHAVNRQAPILAEIVGSASSNSLSAKYQQLENDGLGIITAIQNAMTNAGLTPEDIDLVIPCGSGIAHDDKIEAKAIAKALGQAGKTVPVWPIKSLTSHTGAASGAMDMITAALAIQHGQTGVAVNCEQVTDGCELNIIREPLNKEIKTVLCCGYSFGGQTAAVILRKYEGTAS